MAYSVGLERPFRQVNVAQIVHECTSLLFVAIIFKSNPSRVYSSNLYLKSLIIFFRATFTFNPDVINPDPRCRVLCIVIYVLRQAARTWSTLAALSGIGAPGPL